MKKKRHIWTFAVVLAIVAVQGTVFARAQETESSVEDIAETTAETDKDLETKVLMETVKEQISQPEKAEQISDELQEESEIKKSRTRQIGSTKKSVKKTADGQTLLDVSKGNIMIKSTGATGGGYKQ